MLPLEARPDRTGFGDPGLGSWGVPNLHGPTDALSPTAAVHTRLHLGFRLRRRIRACVRCDVRQRRSTQVSGAMGTMLRNDDVTDGRNQIAGGFGVGRWLTVPCRTRCYGRRVRSVAAGRQRLALELTFPGRDNAHGRNRGRHRLPLWRNWSSGSGFGRLGCQLGDFTHGETLQVAPMDDAVVLH